MLRWLPVAIVGFLGTVASAQVVFSPQDVKPELQYHTAANPRAMQLLRAVEDPARAVYIPRWQFAGLERPYKNPGVWGTPKGTFTYTLPDPWQNQAASTYYKMLDELTIEEIPVPPGQPSEPKEEDAEQGKQDNKAPATMRNERHAIKPGLSKPAYPAQGKIEIKPYFKPMKKNDRIAEVQ